MAHKVLVIQTGGTIDKEYPKTSGGYAFEINAPATERIFQRAHLAHLADFVTVCQKDSQDMTEEDRARLAEMCRDAIQQKILISHGTDTILKTAEYVFQNTTAAEDEQVILLTGAFRPEAFRDTDADFNVGMAYGALQAIESPGVYVALDGKVALWNKFNRRPYTASELCGRRVSIMHENL